MSLGKLIVYIPLSTDVVRAYKGLLKEKEALEASLSALAETSSSKPKPSSDGSAEPAEGQRPPEGEGEEAAADGEAKVKG